MSMSTWRAAAGFRGVRGLTLVEVVTAMAIASIVVSSLSILLGAGIKEYLIEHARVTGQARGREVLAWLADRLRQVNFDPHAPCPEGFLLTGNGNGFPERLAFRAILDESLPQARETYAYYVDGGTLWEETSVQDSPDKCAEEAGRTVPDSTRSALTPAVVRGLELVYQDRNGLPTSSPDLVRSVRITLTLEARSFGSRRESETYATVVTVRGP